MFQNTMSKLNTYKSSKCLTYTTILQSLTSLTSVIIFRLNHSADMMQVFTLPVTSTVFKMYAMTMVRMATRVLRYASVAKLGTCICCSSTNSVYRPPDDLWNENFSACSTWFGVIDTPIDVDENNRWKHVSEFVKHVWHIFLYPVFQEISIENGLSYIRGLQIMLINVDNINQVKFHKCARHI